MIEIIVDSEDRRSRRLKLSDDGRDVLVSALQVWRDTHDEIDELLGETRPTGSRRSFGVIVRLPHMRSA